MDQSLHEIIAAAVADGRLPDGFSVPKQDAGETAMRFVDGGMDGIRIYHMAPGGGPSDEQRALIAAAMEHVSAGRFSEAIAALGDTGLEPLEIYEPLYEYLNDHAMEMDGGNLFRFAFTLATRAPDYRLVKIGLALMGGFDPEEQFKAPVRTLALSDELTYFAMLAMRPWEDSNGEMFRLARHVFGWGRVHLVEALEPETEEIRRWLLREGVHNGVMPQYSAWACWVKGDAPAALKGPLTREDFAGIRDIVDALLNEGPVAGISAVEDADAHLRAFLDRAGEFEPDEDDQRVVEEVRAYLDQAGQ